MTRFSRVIVPAVAAAALCMTLSSGANASIILPTIYSDAADGMVRNDATTTTTGSTASVGKDSGSGSTLRQNAVFVFDLTGVATITEAEFGAYLTTNTVDISKTASLQGVGYGNTAAGWTSVVDYHNSGTSEAGNTTIMNPFVNREDGGNRSATGQYWTTTSGTVEGNLITYLNARPVGQDFVYLRINNNSETANNAKYWRFATADATDANTRPYLNLTVVPEPASLSLLGLGVLPMLRRTRRE